MDITIADQYYVKALNNYPYELETVIENLNYALSYNEDHCQANYLMGRLFMEIMKEYDMAEKYFVKALSCNLNFPDTYKSFSLLKIWNKDFEGALKLIDYALKLKGTNKALMLCRKSMIYECIGSYKKVKFYLKEAKLYCFDNTSIEFIEREFKRIEKKNKVLKKDHKTNKKEMKIK